MTSSPLLKLPVELIGIITLLARELDHDAPCNMSLVCSELNRRIPPHLLTSSVTLDNESKILSFETVAPRCAAYIEWLSITYPGERNRRTAKLELSSAVQRAMGSFVATCASVSRIQVPLDLLVDVIALRSEAGTLHRLTHVSILASIGKPGKPVLPTSAYRTTMDCAGQVAQLQATHVHISGSSTKLVFAAAVARNRNMPVTHLCYDIYPLNSSNSSPTQVPPRTLLPALERLIFRLPVADMPVVTPGNPLHSLMLHIMRDHARLALQYGGDPGDDAEMNAFAAMGWKRHVGGLTDLWESCGLLPTLSMW